MELARFYSAYQKALDEGTAAALIGAGFSAPAGYVNWKELLRDIAEELGLEIDKETDLVAIAQYHVNQARGRGRLNQKLLDEFVKDAEPTDNHHLFAKLPIGTVWTTNYDHLLERAFDDVHKRVDRKVSREDLASTRPRRDVVLYKMHGDIDRPHEAVLTKDDYECYNERHHRQLFSMKLQGDLISKTFLFLGLSFSDPNIDYILGRVRSLVGESRRTHYWVTKDAAAEIPRDALWEARQKHRIEDLKTYGIETVLIRDYREVRSILEELHRRVHRRSVFISGSAAEYMPFGRVRVESLARRLGADLIAKGFNVVSGMGLGIGDAISMGAIEAVYRRPRERLPERTVLRPFPQTDPQSGNRTEIWTRYRKDMLGSARSAIYLLGNKLVSGVLQPASGMREEFAIATEQGVYPIPLGATGHVAQEIWQEVRPRLVDFYGPLAAEAERHFDVLNDAAATDDQLVAAVLALLQILAPR